MPVERMCRDCGRSIIAYRTTDNRCTKCLLIRQSSKPLKPRKAISQRGKHAKLWQTFRDKVAIPYLDKKYGRVCAACKGERCGNKNLDVDHIKGRGSHPDLRYDVKNMQYLGRFPCHVEKTAGI